MSSSPYPAALPSPSPSPCLPSPCSPPPLRFASPSCLQSRIPMPVPQGPDRALRIAHKDGLKFVELLGLKLGMVRQKPCRLFQYGKSTESRAARIKYLDTVEISYLPTRLCVSVPSSMSSNRKPAPVWPNALLKPRYFCLSLNIWVIVVNACE